MNIKNKINKVAVAVLCCTFGLLTVSCEDFLNRPPVTEFGEEEFWQSEAQARMFVYQIYPILFPGYGSGTAEPTTFYFDTGNDDYISAIEQMELGPFVVPETDGQWTFVNVRRANYIIENVHRMDADDATINHWRGVGRFYRAFLYSNLVFRFGDVPFFDRVPVVSDRREDMDFLFKDRDPRTYVVDRIMEDFQYAMEHVRRNDGPLQINRYVVAAMATRLLLREGTFLKYHDIDQEKAEEVLRLAATAAELVMSNSSFRISDNYRALFSSEDLAGNPEIIMYRRYIEGILTHSMLTATTSFPVVGSSRAFAESFSLASGLPVRFENPNWNPVTSEEFFANRDPRLSMVLRPRYFLLGGSDHGFVAQTFSGFSCHKYADDDRFDPSLIRYTRGNNTTDAPVLRLGEVLINYAEIMYELGELDQGVLDRTVNELRGRRGVEMPRLEIVGNMPMVNGIIYDDPVRLELNPLDDVSPILWEIRRERRVELAHEGFRSADLRRWKKLDYMLNNVNKYIRYGAYIRFSDFNPDANGIPDIDGNNFFSATMTPFGGADYHVAAERTCVTTAECTPSTITSGFVLGNSGRYRMNPPTGRNYIHPVPYNQIVLYRDRGYTLSQTREWID